MTWGVIRDSICSELGSGMKLSLYSTILSSICLSEIGDDDELTINSEANFASIAVESWIG